VLQDLLAFPERLERLQHFAFQPLHVLQRNVQEVPRTAGRIEHANGAELSMEGLGRFDGPTLLSSTMKDSAALGKGDLWHHREINKSLFQ